MFYSLLVVFTPYVARAQAQEKKAVVEKPTVEKAAAAKPAAKNVKPAAADEKKLEPKIIQRKLRARTDLSVEKLPLQDVVKKLAEFHEIPIRLDKAALKKANVALDAPVTVNIQNYTLSAALKHILKDFGLHFGVVDGAVLITNTPPEPEEQAVVADVAVVQQARQVQQMAVNEAQQLQQTRQYQAQLRAELNFARHACQATADEMRALRAELEKMDKNVKNQPPPNAAARKGMIVQRQVIRNGQVVQGDPLQLARDRLASAVKTCFSAEQAARFQEEVDQRTADGRRSAALNLVARLDREMILSAKQRDEITESLLAHWNDAWCASLQMFMYNDQFFPTIPDAHVVKFLNENQKKIWATIPKNQGQMVFNGFMGGILGEEVLWNEDDADAPAKAPGE
jgi:hypothetical protein